MKMTFRPWSTPYYLYPVRPHTTRQQGVTWDLGLALDEVDVEDLSEQCDKFRAEVFRKAGKEDPRGQCAACGAKEKR